MRPDLRTQNQSRHIPRVLRPCMSHPQSIAWSCTSLWRLPHDQQPRCHCCRSTMSRSAPIHRQTTHQLRQHHRSTAIHRRCLHHQHSHRQSIPPQSRWTPPRQHHCAVPPSRQRHHTRSRCLRQPQTLRRRSSTRCRRGRSIPCRRPRACRRPHRQPTHQCTSTKRRCCLRTKHQTPQTHRRSRQQHRHQQTRSSHRCRCHCSRSSTRQHRCRRRQRHLQV